MPERARAGLDTGHHGLGMSAQERVEVAETIKLGDREEAAIGEDGIERQAAMPLAQDEAIPLGPPGLCGPVPQEVVVKHPDDLDQRERRPDMASAAFLDARKISRRRCRLRSSRVRVDRLKIGIIVEQRPIFHATAILSEHPAWPSPS